MTTSTRGTSWLVRAAGTYDDLAAARQMDTLGKRREPDSSWLICTTRARDVVAQAGWFAQFDAARQIDAPWEEPSAQQARRAPQTR